MSTAIPENNPEGAAEGVHAVDSGEDAKERKRRSVWIAVGIIAVALVLIQLGIYAIRQSPQEEAAAPPETTAAAESDAPEASGDQSPVPTDGGYVDPTGEQEIPYEAAPGEFRGFDAMSMSIDGAVAPVDPVQLTDTGTLIPPADVSRLGWYSASAVPGTAGAVGSTVITGHINYQGQGEGYAARFTRLSEGELFDVLIDGEPVTFRVSQAPYRLPKGSDFPPEVNDATGPNQLVLITCGGQFVGGALGYADNIITVAEPVSPLRPADAGDGELPGPEDVVVE